MNLFKINFLIRIKFWPITLKPDGTVRHRSGEWLCSLSLFPLPYTKFSSFSSETSQTITDPPPCFTYMYNMFCMTPTLFSLSHMTETCSHQFEGTSSKYQLSNFGVSRFTRLLYSLRWPKSVLCVFASSLLKSELQLMKAPAVKEQLDCLEG